MSEHVNNGDVDKVVSDFNTPIQFLKDTIDKENQEFADSAYFQSDEYLMQTAQDKQDQLWKQIMATGS